MMEQDYEDSSTDQPLAVRNNNIMSEMAPDDSMDLKRQIVAAHKDILIHQKPHVANEFRKTDLMRKISKDFMHPDSQCSVVTLTYLDD